VILKKCVRLVVIIDKCYYIHFKYNSLNQWRQTFFDGEQLFDFWTTWRATVTLREHSRPGGGMQFRISQPSSKIVIFASVWNSRPGGGANRNFPLSNAFFSCPLWGVKCYFLTHFARFYMSIFNLFSSMAGLAPIVARGSQHKLSAARLPPRAAFIQLAGRTSMLFF